LFAFQGFLKKQNKHKLAGRGLGKLLLYTSNTPVCSVCVRLLVSAELNTSHVQSVTVTSNSRLEVPV